MSTETDKATNRDQRPATWLFHCLLWLCQFVFIPLVLASGDHDHGGHAAQDEHAHDDEPTLVYTHYSDHTELFVEFPPLVAGRASTFAAHFTRLDHFQPLTDGILDVHLKQAGQTVARFRVQAPARKGIFLPAVTPRKAGRFQLVLELTADDLHAIHDLGEVTVFTDPNAVAVHQEAPVGDIRYLKEQQWDNPFAIVRAQSRPLRPSVPGFGTVQAPADGYAVIRAAEDGYFATEHFMNAGQMVTAEQTLGAIIPRLGVGADIGHLLVAQERARSQLQLAQAEVARLQGLFKQGAIAEKRLLEAREALNIARVELHTAESRLQQRSGRQSQAGITLRAPISGEIVSATVRPGGFVRAGDELFTLASTDQRWLDVQVPEKFGTNIRHASGVWLHGESGPLVLDAAHGATVVKVSPHVAAATRTVALAIEYPTATGPALLGARYPVHVLIGEAQPLLAVPQGAVIDDGGQSVVYVQSGGETFDRRVVTLGIQDGDWVNVLSGIDAGEWVVARGAYFVKLASAGGDTIGHGHAH